MLHTKKKFSKEFIFFRDWKINFFLSLSLFFIPPNLVPHIENLVVNNHVEHGIKKFWIAAGRNWGFLWSRFPKTPPVLFGSGRRRKRWPSSSLVSGTSGSGAKRDSVNKVAGWWLFFVVKLCCTARVQCKRCLRCLLTLPLKRHFHLKVEKSIKIKFN